MLSWTRRARRWRDSIDWVILRVLLTSCAPLARDAAHRMSVCRATSRRLARCDLGTGFLLQITKSTGVRHRQVVRKFCRLTGW
ncbi:hypothetical protein A5715_07720 [Mycolicibacter heraklionensis]|nr:hypothetical protein A5715_07720 [Mycolicibacter heraklionensis]